jgi:hypothetical protein
VGSVGVNRKWSGISLGVMWAVWVSTRSGLGFNSIQLNSTFIFIYFSSIQDMLSNCKILMFSLGVMWGLWVSTGSGLGLIWGCGCQPEVV